MNFVTEEILGPHTGTLASTGAFVAIGVPVARCGVQVYRASEIGIEGGSERVKVWRFPEQVFDPKSMASGEGKPICLTHPTKFIVPENWKALSVGHMQNVRPGTVPLDDGNLPLLADLVIADVTAIDEVKRGLRSTSLGYECEYTPLENGDWFQAKIVINHLALVSAPRSGNTRIMDGDPMYTIEDAMKKLDELTKLLATRRTQAAPVKSHEALLAEVQDDEFSRQIAMVDASPECVAFCEAANRLGRALRGERDCRPGLRERAADAVAAINEQGERLRGRR